MELDRLRTLHGFRRPRGTTLAGIRETIARAFGIAGVTLNGERPWDIRVHDERFYARVLSDLSLGLGETYTAGWWDAPDLPAFFERIYRADLQQMRTNWAVFYYHLRARILNLQKPSRAFEVGVVHYDKGNDLYRAMLGPQLVYSSGYYRLGDETLAEAEEAKLELIGRKLGLRAGQRILDIGCGWGSFARYAARRYGVEVHGVTVSQEQAALARERCAGLPITIEVRDYRALEGRYDHVVSIGMIGHVGQSNYRRLMEIVERCLEPSGLFLVHTMGANRSAVAAERWIDRYIFPNGMAPSIKQLGECIEGLFVMEDWHNFSTDYGVTLQAWARNFETNWPRLSSRYDERFRRMWRYYLHCFSAAFMARTLQTWDIVLSKTGERGKYIAAR